MTVALAAAGSNSTALWYLSRGTGAVALVLLTGALALGIADVTRWRSQRWPRFVVDALHGTLSLAAIVLLAGHIVTSVLDPFAPLRLTDAVIPFAGQYRPVWLGLGALSFDLLLVLVVSSVWRRHIGPRAWRAVHWTAYACWPLALVHALGTGSDVRRGWMLVLAAVCTAVVVIALGTRLAAARGPGARIARPATLATMAAGVLALAVWLPLGPLANNWARRAGTPVALLTRPATAAAQTAPATPTLHLPFTAHADGRLRSGIAGDGTALVDIALRVADGSNAALDVRLAGSSLAGGGVSVSRSQVTLGPPADPAQYIGRLISLDGNTLDARLRPAHGRAVRVHALLNLGNGGAGPVSATVSARRETA